MARSAWSGAIQFAGFPIHLSAYTLTKSAESFKGLCSCHGQPIKQDKFCSVDGTRVARSGEEGDPNLITTSKGVQVARGKYVILPDEAAELIGRSDRSEVLAVERFAPVDSVAFVYSQMAMRLVPNEKVPGAAQPVEILWNGLRTTERAAIIDGWIARAGSRPQLLAIHADGEGLLANVLPYESWLKTDVPSHAFVENQQAAEMFEQVVNANYETDPFDHSAYTDTYTERRDELVQKALAGEVIEVEQAPTQHTAAPDLMAAMQQALGQAKPAPKKRAPAKKSKAKAA